MGSSLDVGPQALRMHAVPDLLRRHVGEGLDHHSSVTRGVTFCRDPAGRSHPLEQLIRRTLSVECAWPAQIAQEARMTARESGRRG
jgi:hypothetical protein